MGKIIMIILITGLMNVISCMNISTKQINKLTKAEKNEGWELLFDGESLSGWRFFKGGEVKGWKVIDGVLFNSGKGSDQGGDIVTEKTFRDFELYLEWKIDSLSNSGIFFHARELDSIKWIYESAPEYQLIDDVSFKERLHINRLSGANYEMHEPVGAVVKPSDQWNETKIIVKGPHVEHWLNGIKVVEYELWTDDWFNRKNNGKWKDYPHYGLSEDGYIGLQDHGGLTQFRNIKIRKL